MTTIATRSSLLAVKPEVTEGTPVAPAGATDFTALQDDFDMTPNQEQIDNNELTGSIGEAPKILGIESPTTSFSHYIRASGVAGTAPDYNDLLKGFFGTETVNGTERVTTTASTVSLIKAAAGGSDFARGCGLLIKDPVNGYRIRVADSVATNDVSISFDLPTAPGSGVGLGKCVFYSPANEGHQALTLWHYLGNGGAVQMMAGVKVTEFGFTAEAGQPVNASFSFEGVAYYLNPVEITDTSNYIDWEDDDGVVAASITAKWYKNPFAVAAALQAAMNAVGSTETATVTYSKSTGKYTIKTTGTLLTIKWNTGTNAANTIGAKLGFLTAADDSGTVATTGYTSDNASVLVAPYTPTYDTNTQPTVAKYQEVMIGEHDEYVCFEASSYEYSGTNTRRPIQSICAESGQSGSVITQRTGTVTVKALLNKYDVYKYRQFVEGTTVKCQYSFGPKVGGNWVAGSCGYHYVPTGKITSLKITDDDGLAALELEITPCVIAGLGEVFLGFV